MDHEGVFLANVSCRILRASRGFAPRPTPGVCPGSAGGSKHPHLPDPQGGQLHAVPPSTTFIPHLIFKQQTQGKTSILMRKHWGKWWKSSETREIDETPVRKILYRFRPLCFISQFNITILQLTKLKGKKCIAGYN